MMARAVAWGLIGGVLLGAGAWIGSSIDGAEDRAAQDAAVAAATARVRDSVVRDFARVRDSIGRARDSAAAVVDAAVAAAKRRTDRALASAAAAEQRATAALADTNATVGELRGALGQLNAAFGAVRDSLLAERVKYERAIAQRDEDEAESRLRLSTASEELLKAERDAYAALERSMRSAVDAAHSRGQRQGRLQGAVGVVGVIALSAAVFNLLGG